MAEQQGQKSNQSSSMGPGETTENLLPNKQCLNHCKSLSRRSVQKANKCIQVDLDLEEENPSADLRLSPTTCLSKKPQQCLGNPSPSQQGISSSSQGQPAMPALLPLLPPPPSLPPGHKVPLPPLPVPGMYASSLPPPPPCGNPVCNHLTCGYGGQPHPKKTPTLRMKVLHWQKLPSDVVRQSRSMWAVVPRGSKELIEPDYASLEMLFCVPPTPPKEKTRPKKNSKEITFIGPKKSLLLSIFLKQFKCSNEEIADMIHKGDRSQFDAEILKQLLKLLPEGHEISSLKSCKEERSELANADQFYLHLLEVPSYQLRIECMLICEETKFLLECLWPKAKAIRTACETLLTSQQLPVFCQLILKVGNFLNYGHHTGDAGGFKISALLRLTETKANKSHVTLLHHILEEVEKNHADLLQLPRDLDFVSKAAGFHFDAMRAEASANLKKLLEIEKRLFLSTEDLKIQHAKSVQSSISASKDLQEEFASIEKKKEELADYLCEDRKKLSLEDVFNTMKTFRELFLKALQLGYQNPGSGVNESNCLFARSLQQEMIMWENQQRKEQAAKSEKRKKHLKGEDVKRLKREDGKSSIFNKK
ncbi:inverted formin-2-like isoform X1 [Cygnus olor]|uniref:inverted formin-2-like isoform X1 n=1 Tax=Cygnus olor TaxID=8869 RepID=UPI001ADDEDAF|nr:inverted formin-2-like isoform X1 [Cygnus olor]